MTSHRELTLSDGRILAFYDYGDPDGVPCIYTTGTPASGLAGAIYDAVARRKDVRWISVDKPGYGRSTYDPQRSLQRYAADVAALADHLGLDRFAAAGESGGGPHVLAVARYVPQRVTTAIVLAGMGPGTERWVLDGMKPLNRRLFRLAQRAPWALRVPTALMGRMMSNAERVKRFAEKQLTGADRAFWSEHPDLAELFHIATADAFRQGSRATAQELAMFARPWGFRIEEVTVPTHVWHGTEDTNVPVAVARRLCELLPRCTPHILPGRGHIVSMAEPDLIMKTVVAAWTGRPC